MESFVREEGCDLCGRMGSIIVCEFCKGQEVCPIILLVVDIDVKVLLQDLVYSLCLSISLGVVGG